ncbi:MAG: sigma-70 family RNA polymerase sigma factor, partial [Planctomycetes bacterium]|nr:sigma-70 family RNA polymerase sigma factor [Planctomycetota bacterium]
MTADTPVPIDELLAHRDWVRGLARALVRDANDADDLAQDAWQRALRNPPRAGGSVRSWFATVLRNRASELRRNDARRGARSGDGTDPDTVAGRRDDCSPAELAERAELERRVLSIVNDLDAPHRDVVLLRFWRGLGADEIAALRGIAPATARTRLHRALAEVRGRLDRDLGGRDARHAALLPIAALEHGEGVGCGAARSRATSGSRLVAGLAICAIVVAAACLAAARWPSSGGTPTGGVPSARSAGASPRATGPAAPRGRARPAAAPVMPVEDAAVPAAAPTPASMTEDVAIVPAHVHVRVVDAAGRPVAGARVVTARTDGGKSGRVVTMTGETVSGGEVDFAWAGEPATVRALAQFGVAAGVSEAFDIEPGATVGTGIELGDAKPVGGRVVRPDGAPAPGAYVMLYGSFDDTLEEIAAATADADGRFDFGPIPVGIAAGGSIETAAAGFPRAWTLLREAGDAGTLTIRLDEPMVVIGRLIDERGAPVVDATVDVSGSNTAFTDAQGRFRTEPIRPAKARAVILPDGHAPRAIDLGEGASGTRDLGDVVLSAGRPIRGQVVSSDGTPVPGAFVWIDDRDAD